jgi:succinoglycan biosynthesis protein ExoA
MDLPLFVAVGGYDEQMATNEDAELDFRLTAKGTLIWLSAENSIGYFPRATPVRLMTQYFRFGAGRADTVTRHRIRPKVRQLAMIFLGPAVLGAVMTPVLTVAAIPLAAWTGISLSYGAWIAVQARSVCAIGAGPAAMIMHMSWSMGFWWFLITRGAARMRAAPTPASALGGPGC